MINNEETIKEAELKGLLQEIETKCARIRHRIAFDSIDKPESLDELFALLSAAKQKMEETKEHNEKINSEGDEYI